MFSVQHETMVSRMAKAFVLALQRLAALAPSLCLTSKYITACIRAHFWVVFVCYRQTLVASSLSHAHSVPGLKSDAPGSSSDR